MSIVAINACYHVVFMSFGTFTAENLSRNVSGSYAFCTIYLRSITFEFIVILTDCYSVTERKNAHVRACKTNKVSVYRWRNGNHCCAVYASLYPMKFRNPYCEPLFSPATYNTNTYLTKPVSQPNRFTQYLLIDT